MDYHAALAPLYLEAGGLRFYGDDRDSDSGLLPLKPMIFGSPAPPVGPCCFTASQVALKSSHSLGVRVQPADSDAKKKKQITQHPGLVNQFFPFFSNILRYF